MPRRELFSRYPTLWPQRGDSESVIREKFKARRVLEEVLLEIGEKGLTWKETTSSIACTCDHKNPTKGFVYRVFPTFGAYKKDKWEFESINAEVAHRMYCEGWQEIQDKRR